MKCKVFKIHLQNETDEAEFDRFLASVKIKQTFASIVNEVESFWSVMVFYEEINAAAKAEKSPPFAQSPLSGGKQYSISAAAAIDEVPAAAEPEPFNPAQEKFFVALRNWRDERAKLEGLPAYVVAHDELLMQIAAAPIKTKQDLLMVKDFGHQRTEIYGAEIIQILTSSI